MQTAFQGAFLKTFCVAMCAHKTEHLRKTMTSHLNLRIL